MRMNPLREKEFFLRNCCREGLNLVRCDSKKRRKQTTLLSSSGSDD